MSDADVVDLNELLSSMLDPVSNSSSAGVLLAKLDAAETLLERVNASTEIGAKHGARAIAFLVTVAKGDMQADTTARVRAVKILTKKGYGQS